MLNKGNGLPHYRIERELPCVCADLTACQVTLPLGLNRKTLNRTVTPRNARGRGGKTIVTLVRQVNRQMDKSLAYRQRLYGAQDLHPCLLLSRQTHALIEEILYGV